MVAGFSPSLEKKVLCRRAQIYCNGVETCDLFDENILAGCQRFEPDEYHMLWNHELDANAKEASLAVGIISRCVWDSSIFVCTHSIVQGFMLGL
jgi:hypothetical protein